MATAKRLRPESPTDPELGIRVISPRSEEKQTPPVSIEVREKKEQPSGQEILLRSVTRRSPALGTGRRRKHKKGRKSRKTRKHH